MARYEKVGKTEDLTPEEMAAVIGKRIAEEFGKAGLSGYQHCVLCADRPDSGKMAALMLPFENIDVDEQAIDPATGLIIIQHVLTMMDNAFEAAGRRDMKDAFDSYMDKIARPIMTIGNLVSVILPRMAEQGGSPVVWKVNDGDEGAVLVIADGRHFSDIDGMPDAYLMGSLLDFIFGMAAKGAGQMPIGAEMQSIIDDIESEINGEKGKKDE